MSCNMGLKRGRTGQPDEVAISQLLKIDLAAAGKLSAPRATSIKRSSLNKNRSRLSGRACSAAKPRSAAPLAIAFALLDVNADIGMFP